MGIRFEYGSRRATNGPMIFFSDPVSEVNLKEEIRGAVESRLCFYAYHAPGDMMMTFGSSEGTVMGIGTPGFVIAPFLPDVKTVTIPYAPVPRSLVQEAFPFPSAATTREQHKEEVIAIKETLSQIGFGKIVAARVNIINETIDPAEIFLKLCKNYPKAFSFCFSTPYTGCWIGATPELLLEARGGKFHTMALAGTRRAGSAEEWDEKNREEQKMVTDYIMQVFKDFNLEPVVQQTVTKNAGAIEHICTPISTRIPTVGTCAASIEEILHTLSPTPAVAGLPKESAIKIIKEYEAFPRAFYGGFCGPYRSPSDFSMFVTLRSGRIEAERYALYAGGGITSKSDPDAEWEETALKLETLKTIITDNQ